MAQFCLTVTFLCCLLIAGSSAGLDFTGLQVQDTSRVDRHYKLEATMLGYFAPDGTRNPTLRA
ncbi:MAG TPA: hypothetical protein VIQ51_09790, partial [Chryseosolibacter sp.]